MWISAYYDISTPRVLKHSPHCEVGAVDKSLMEGITTFPNTELVISTPDGLDAPLVRGMLHAHFNNNWLTACFQLVISCPTFTSTKTYQNRLFISHAVNRQYYLPEQDSTRLSQQSDLRASFYAADIQCQIDNQSLCDHPSLDMDLVINKRSIDFN